jgi:DNA excision repair protein ERCC-4
MFYSGFRYLKAIQSKGWTVEEKPRLTTLSRGKTVLKILIDTREQNPFTFQKYDCQVQRATLPTGDYAPQSFEDRCAVERKELNDLVACLMGTNRDRFERELERGGAMECFSVVVEASMEDIAQHRYTSKMKSHAVLQSILAFQVRYKVPPCLLGPRRALSTPHTAFLRSLRLSNETKANPQKLPNPI